MKFLFLFLLFSCATKVPTLRSPYQLQSVNDFVVSNIYVHPAQLDQTKDGVRVKYDVVVRNLLQTSRQIDLTSAALISKAAAFPLSCHSFKNQEVAFTVGAQETFRIQCEGKVKKSQVPSGDNKLIVNIPLSGEEALFSYLVRAEDFQ